MSDEARTTHFFEDGIEVVLLAEGPRSRLEISVDTGVHAGTDAVELEVLFQPRDQHGLANGAPAVLYASRWPITRLRPDGRALADGWLPRALEPGLARRCYYRVSPIIMDAPTN